MTCVQRPLITYLPDQKPIQLTSLSKLPVPLPSSSAPGTAIYDPHIRSLVVRCAGNTYLSVDKVKQEGKKEVMVKEWWNGVRGSMKGDGGGLVLGLGDRH